MSTNKQNITLGTRHTDKCVVVSGSRLVSTSKRVKNAMKDAKRKFERIEHLSKEDASRLLLNS